MPEGDAYNFRSWLDLLSAGLAARGSDAHGIRRVTTELRAAGFVDIHDEARKCPVGTWPADHDLRVCGGLLAENYLEGLWGMSARPFAALGWTRTQIEMFLVEVREHVRMTEFHAYVPLWTVYGRKPRK